MFTTGETVGLVEWLKQFFFNAIPRIGIYTLCINSGFFLLKVNIFCSFNTGVLNISFLYFVD